MALAYTVTRKMAHMRLDVYILKTQHYSRHFHIFNTIRKPCYRRENRAMPLQTSICIGIQRNRGRAILPAIACTAIPCLYFRRTCAGKVGTENCQNGKS